MGHNTQPQQPVQVISNEVFLKSIFGSRFNTVHTTSFKPDPLNVKRMAWAGYPYYIQAESDARTIEDWDYNNYFVISTFIPDTTDPQQPYRRRKELFEQCHLVVVDDVHQKVDPATLRELGFPRPTYQLATSKGNEQWGYVFTTPVTERTHIEYLLSMWVAKGISCDGKDPGMKGVTRYVRLPIGSNTKKLYGEPWRHQMMAWNPEIRYPIEDLAKMTGVDLDQAPPDNSLHAQTIIPDEDDEMLKALGEAGILRRKIKPGVFDLECPWIDEHTQRADTGAAYIQPAGFRCHHGSCVNRTGRHLRQWLREGGYLKTMTAAEMFADIRPLEGSQVPVEQVVPVIAPECYILDLDKFYEPHTGLYYSRDTMNARNPKDDPKDDTYVTRFFRHVAHNGYSQFISQTYHPGKPPVIVDERGEHMNMWRPSDLQPIDGDVTPWIDLAKRLIPDESERRHVIRWMAQCVQYQHKKINHCLLITGDHGTGKDTFIEPLIQAIGKKNHRAVDISEMHSDFNAYLKGKKLIVFNEVMHFQGKREIEQRLKPILAAPPTMLSINQKFMPVIEVPNVVNSIMFSNEGHQAAAVSKGDRRYFCVNSPAAKLDDDYAAGIWDWYYNNQGLQKVYYYLQHIVDVSDFNPTAAPPDTQFKQEIIEAGYSPLKLLVLDTMAPDEESPGDRAWQVFTLDKLKAAMGMDPLKDVMEKSALERGSIDRRIGTVLRDSGYTMRRVKINGVAKRVWYNREIGNLSNEELRMALTGLGEKND